MAAAKRRKELARATGQYVPSKQDTAKHLRWRKSHPDRAKVADRNGSRKRRARLREAEIPTYDKEQTRAYAQQKYAELKADPERYAAYLARCRANYHQRKNG